MREGPTPRSRTTLAISVSFFTAMARSFNDPEHRNTRITHSGAGVPTMAASTSARVIPAASGSGGPSMRSTATGSTPAPPGSATKARTMRDD